MSVFSKKANQRGRREGSEKGGNKVGRRGMLTSQELGGSAPLERKKLTPKGFGRRPVSSPDLTVCPAETAEVDDVAKKADGQKRLQKNVAFGETRSALRNCPSVAWPKNCKVPIWSEKPANLETNRSSSTIES
jgi:hypothetical protein